MLLQQRENPVGQEQKWYTDLATAKSEAPINSNL